MQNFYVIDTQTGRPPDTERIALNEDWAEKLIYCNMDGFAVTEDGELILIDTCGNYRSCPPGRFRIVPNIRTEAEIQCARGGLAEAETCGTMDDYARGYRDALRWIMGAEEPE